ncbi:MAG: DUF2493 domain-containing protein [Rhodospirillaceae bacterium]|nr:DUF2493 domain-containing protein [Rhodospirillaceae bacterium]
MKVLVCGGSRYGDEKALFARLDAIHAERPITLVINGGARGADLLSSRWARSRGVTLQVFHADRRQQGDGAFFALNARMLAETCPDLVLAFPSGAVTADLVRRAEALAIPVVRCR